MWEERDGGALEREDRRAPASPETPDVGGRSDPLPSGGMKEALLLLDDDAGAVLGGVYTFADLVKEAGVSSLLTGGLRNPSTSENSPLPLVPADGSLADDL